VINYYDTPHSCGLAKQTRYSMKTVLESHNARYNVGGDLGVQDVIVLRIEQGTFSEKEMYAKGWGLVRWQGCTLDGSSCQDTVTWNKFSPNPPKRLDVTASCTGLPPTVSLEKIRKLSVKYFGVESQNNAAVNAQLDFLARGGTLKGIEDYFSLVRYTWVMVTGAPPPSYGWVDLGMNYFVAGGTAQRYMFLVQQAVGPQVLLRRIRQLSTQYFGVESQSNAAVNAQLDFLARGGTLRGIEDYFSLIRQTWVSTYGAPPPAYGWVDSGMNFFVAGGTVDQYTTAVRQAVARYYR
jgi:hypothetical protein